MLKKSLKPSDVMTLKFKYVNFSEFKCSYEFQAKAIQFFSLILGQSHPKNTPKHFFFKFCVHIIY